MVKLVPQPVNLDPVASVDARELHNAELSEIIDALSTVSALWLSRFGELPHV